MHYRPLGPADAIAEFVDNSIQACTDSSCNIEINIVLNYDQPNYFIIKDNGKGMVMSDIDSFATYSNDHSSRLPCELNSAEKSMFGVGAKQGGSYIGNCIHMISCAAVDATVVREIVLDKEELDRRASAGQDVMLSVTSIILYFVDTSTLILAVSISKISVQQNFSETHSFALSTR